MKTMLFTYQFRINLMSNFQVYIIDKNIYDYRNI